MTTRLQLVVGILFGGLLIGCDRVLISQPKPSDLVGTYILSKESASFLAKHKSYPSIPVSSMQLRPDFSMSITNLADCADNGFGKSSGGFLSGEGKWWVKKDFIEWSLAINGSVAPYVQIRGRSAPYRLAVVVGDPDSGETLQYVRQSSEPDGASNGSQPTRPSIN
jgi:hypothetical protein